MRQEYLDLGQIRIDFPLSYEYIKEISIEEEANEHSTLNLKLVVNGEMSQEEALRLTETPIKVYGEEGSSLYYGVCVQAGLHQLNRYGELTLRAKSWSSQADRQKNTRTFQRPDKT